MTIKIPEHLFKQLRQQLAPLKLKHCYFALTPKEEFRERIASKKMSSVKQFRSIACSSEDILRYRETYLSRYSQHDRIFSKKVPKHTTIPKVWPITSLSPRYQDALRQQYDRLGIQSRFSYWAVVHNDYHGFFKGFSELSEFDLESQLQLNLQSTQDALAVFCSQLTSSHMQLLNPVTNCAVLSKSCIEILRYAADGDSSQEIAEKLHLTERGVNYHIDRAREVLGARNRIHLISLAHRQGII